LTTAWSKELEFAIRAVRKAAEIAIGMQPGITAETKSDQSPVTPADRECERQIVALIDEAFPEDGILGEEGARKDSRSGRRWIIDPIDGTRDYLRGNMLWANLIALEANDEVIAGVVNLPMMGHLYSAARGAGAFCDGARIHASSKTTIEESVLCFNDFSRVKSPVLKAAIEQWLPRFWAVRGLGGAADAMMVAAGQAEVWIEPRAATWDFAPLKVIVEEAGGRFLNLDGGSSIHAGNGITCAPGLEAEVRRLLRSAATT